MSDLIIKKPNLPGGIKRVEFNETKEQNDSVPCVRLYCTMAHQGYELQIRATTQIGSRYTDNEKKQRNLIASISMGWDDLVQIADYVAKEKKERAKWMAPDNYQMYPAEVIRQGLESNSSEFNADDFQTLTNVLKLVESGDITAARELIDKGSETVKFYTIKPDDK